jgi:hypothetical protein
MTRIAGSRGGMFNSSMPMLTTNVTTLLKDRGG